MVESRVAGNGPQSHRSTEPLKWQGDGVHRMKRIRATVAELTGSVRCVCVVSSVDGFWLNG